MCVMVRWWARGTEGGRGGRVHQGGVVANMMLRRICRLVSLQLLSAITTVWGGKGPFP